MAKIAELLSNGFTFSVELWPPRTEEAEARLERVLDELRSLQLSFVSITYGAGGSTRERTHDLVVRLKNEYPAVPMAHLTCAAHSKAELVEILDRYLQEGVENILALKGDPPLDAAEGLEEGELVHAIELVELAKSIGPFCVAVAAHPEGHPDSIDLRSDREHLAQKLRKADFAITQFFFKVEDYLRLMDDLMALSVEKPVIPGIMPITNARTVYKMAAMAGTNVPEELSRRVELYADKPEELRGFGIEVATSLAEELVEAGVPGIHVYTMNQAQATVEIYENLNMSSRVGR
ncbi:MAG: methylenetetrahydrofolate reductase [Actinobacteria bacterium]|jgi:methylenetetrahydrofolate reductase (NADPH)|nr:methylenetetrahydrofolate reductase [Actinomycetota bacterium]